MAERGWQIEPELEQPLPRRTRLRRRAVIETMILAAGLMVVGGFSIGMLAWQAWLTHCDRQAARGGTEAFVTVISKRKQTGRFGRTTGHVIQYRFRTTTGETHEASRKISREDFERIEIGDELAARAVPGRFEYHSLRDVPRAGLTYLDLGALATFVAAAPFLVAMFVRQRRQERELVRFGTAVSGIVSHKSRVKRGRSRYRAKFASAGAERSVSNIAPANVAETGEAVTILHDPLDPEKAIIYAASAYRAACNPG